MKNADTRQRDALVVAVSQQVVRLQLILDRSLAPVLAAYELTGAEFDVLAALRALGAQESIRPKDLASRLLLTTGGLSNVLRRLESERLIARIPEPTDGRSHKVRLTREGATVALAAITAGTAALSASLEPAPDETLARAFDALRPLMAAIDYQPPRVASTRDRRTRALAEATST
ncbi:MAG: MarR family winged helix-turn-helix transcriptional regulator [Rhodoglobus sp.]